MAFTHSLLQTNEGAHLHIGLNLASVQNYFFALDYSSVCSHVWSTKLAGEGEGVKLG